MKKIFALHILFLFSLVIQAEQTLIIQPLNEAEYSETISQIGYIRYSQDSLSIYSHANTLIQQAAFSEIRKLVFTENSSNPTHIDNTSSTSIRVFPNPAQDALWIENTISETIRIVTLQGKIVKTIQAQEGTTIIPVSSLQTGTYLLLINTEIVKFIKQ